MHEFTIQRSKWVRGTIGGDSKLLNSQGNKCCLGFLCSSFGAHDDILKNQTGPDKIANKLSLPDWLVHWSYQASIEGTQVWHPFSTYATNVLISVNDCSLLTEKQREEKLAEVFAVHGVKVTFVD